MVFLTPERFNLCAYDESCREAKIAVTMPVVCLDGIVEIEIRLIIIGEMNARSLSNL